MARAAAQGATKEPADTRLVLTYQESKAKAIRDVTQAAGALLAGKDVVLQLPATKTIEAVTAEQASSSGSEYWTILSGHKDQKGLLVVQGGTLNMGRLHMRVKGRLRLERVMLLVAAGSTGLQVAPGASLWMHGCTLQGPGQDTGSSRSSGGGGKGTKVRALASSDTIGAVDVQKGGTFEAQASLFKGLSCFLQCCGTARVERCLLSSLGADCSQGFSLVVVSRHHKIRPASRVRPWSHTILTLHPSFHYLHDSPVIDTGPRRGLQG